MFSLRTDIKKQTITFSLLLTVIQYFTTNINVTTTTSNLFIKKKDRLGLEKPTNLSVLEWRRTLSYFR